MKRAYADLLYRWGLLEQHAMVGRLADLEASWIGVEWDVQAIDGISL